MNIFVEIMNLIEQKGNIPLMMKDIEKWKIESEKNKVIFKIYTLASNARKLGE